MMMLVTARMRTRLHRLKVMNNLPVGLMAGSVVAANNLPPQIIRARTRRMRSIRSWPWNALENGMITL